MAEPAPFAVDYSKFDLSAWALQESVPSAGTTVVRTAWVSAQEEPSRLPGESRESGG